MFGIDGFWIFVLAGLLLNMTPGPDTAYILARSAQYGWRGGTAAALGIGAGCLVHIAAGAAGLSALLAASATAFAIVKLAGAAYLVYLGLSMLLKRAPGRPAAEAPHESSSPATVFWQGFWTNVLNPKVAIFFLAFMPQFIAADAPSKTLAFVLLGVVFNVNGTVWNLGVAALAARVAGSLGTAGALRHWIERGLGGLFVALGVRMALLERG
jgi:threonine/homoserine/homoserine lactone efflux protein